MTQIPCFIPWRLALKGAKTPQGSDQNRDCGVWPKSLVLSPGFLASKGEQDSSREWSKIGFVVYDPNPLFYPLAFSIEGGPRLLKGVIKIGFVAFDPSPLFYPLAFWHWRGTETPQGSDQDRFCGAWPNTFFYPLAFFSIEGGPRLLKGVIKIGFVAFDPKSFFYPLAF